MATWIECPRCGGVFLISLAPDELHAGGRCTASLFAHRDGTPCKFGDLIRCEDCGAEMRDWVLREGYKARRDGDALPPPPTATEG